MNADATTPLPEPGDDARPLINSVRIKHGATGRGVVMTGGGDWLIPDAPTSEALDNLRDRLFDKVTKDKTAGSIEIRSAAIVLLRHNYNVSLSEALHLVDGANAQQLTNAVAAALLGPDYGDPRRRKTYSIWVRTSLAANGLDPRKIEPALLHDVLDTLIRTGRAVPAEDYCDVALFVKKREQLDAEVKW